MIRDICAIMIVALLHECTKIGYMNIVCLGVLIGCPACFPTAHASFSDMPSFIVFFFATWYALDFLEASAFLAAISADMLGSCGALGPVLSPDGSEDLETRPNPEDLVGRAALVRLAVMLVAAALLRLALLLRPEEVGTVEEVSTVLLPDSPATVPATSLDLPLDLRDLRVDFGALLDSGTLVALRPFLVPTLFALALALAFAFAFAVGLSPLTSVTGPVDRFDFLFFGGGLFDPRASGSWESDSSSSSSSTSSCSSEVLFVLGLEAAVP